MNEKRTVFVVDDEPAVARAVSRLLRASGYATQVFGSAQDFMARYKPGTGDCLVVDYSMPGVSGPDLQQWLANSWPPLPIVLLTGLDEIPDPIRAMLEGAVNILIKPVDAAALLEGIEEAFDRNRKSPETLKALIQVPGESSSRICEIENRPV